MTRIGAANSSPRDEAGRPVAGLACGVV